MLQIDYPKSEVLQNYCAQYNILNNRNDGQHYFNKIHVGIKLHYPLKLFLNRLSSTASYLNLCTSCIYICNLHWLKKCRFLRRCFDRYSNCGQREEGVLKAAQQLIRPQLTTYALWHSFCTRTFTDTITRMFSHTQFPVHIWFLCAPALDFNPI